jgi:hopene-associated glycosyltransferase HpnB
MSLVTVIAALSLAAWLYLLFGRGFFWLPRWPVPAPAPAAWPRVAVIVPARDEAAVVGEAVTSLLQQEYSGEFSVTLVDDHSTDGTAEIARAAALRLDRSWQLQVVTAAALPAGWSGKLWALSEGVAAVEAAGEPPDLLLLTDADISHPPLHLASLVARLEAERRDLVSEMVLLHCQSAAERLMIPAFVFFFGMLYPFAWSNDPQSKTAAAAGGAMLLRLSAYRRIGGFAAIRGAIIDDCALAKAVKASGGSLWLGLTKETRSLRRYPRLGDLWQMVVRTAYAQLQYSPALLAATIIGLALVFLAPVALILTGSSGASLAIAAWVAMTSAYLPMVLFYELKPPWALLLPVAALVYLAATVDSARRYWQGAGGQWKGRAAWRHRN